MSILIMLRKYNHKYSITYNKSKLHTITAPFFFCGKHTMFKNHSRRKLWIYTQHLRGNNWLLKWCRKKNVNSEIIMYTIAGMLYTACHFVTTAVYHYCATTGSRKVDMTKEEHRNSFRPTLSLLDLKRQPKQKGEERKSEGAAKISMKTRCANKIETSNRWKRIYIHTYIYI